MNAPIAHIANNELKLDKSRQPLSHRQDDAVSTPDNRRHIVLIGAGFAGIRCLEQLAKYSADRITLVDRNDYHFFPLFGRTLTILDTLDQSFLATLKEGQSLLVCTSHTAHIGTVRFIDDTVIRVSYANGLNAQFDRHGISISATLWLRPLSDATQGNHALIDSIIQAANILKRQNPRLSMQQIVDLRHALATIEA